MAAPRDNMNLLPDRERQAGEAAIKRAAQPGKAGEVRLSMPQSQKVEPVNKSWWQSYKEKRAKKALVVPPIPVPAPKPVVKPVVVTTAPAPIVKAAPVVVPKPAVKPAPIPVVKPTVVVPPPPPAPTPTVAKPHPKETMVARTPVKKETAKPAPVSVKVASAKTVNKKGSDDNQGSKMHQPDSTNGFLSPKVNLVPEGVAAEAEGIAWGLYGGIVAVVLGIWIGVSGYAIMRAQKAEAAVSEANARLSQIKTVIREYETDKNAQLALQKQFGYVKDLINGHVYWTPFLQKLEETTIPDVYYLGVSANRNGEITLRAVAKNYSAAARQIRAFERASSFVSTVQVSQVGQELQKDSSLPVPVIAFDVQLKLVNGIFTISAPDAAAATTPNQP